MLDSLADFKGTVPVMCCIQQCPLGNGVLWSGTPADPVYLPIASKNWASPWLQHSVPSESVMPETPSERLLVIPPEQLSAQMGNT